jgi:hypothetical protein
VARPHLDGFTASALPSSAPDRPGIAPGMPVPVVMPASPDFSDADLPESYEREILSRILWAEEDWFTVQELSHSVGDVIAALDAMSILFDAGLIQRRDEYVLPTRSAIKVHELFGTCW